MNNVIGFIGAGNMGSSLINGIKKVVLKYIYMINLKKRWPPFWTIILSYPKV